MTGAQADAEATVVAGAEDGGGAEDAEGQVVIGRTGNAGWYCANFGQLSQGMNTSASELSQQIQKFVKENPAHVIGMQECEAHLEDLLKTPVPAAVAAPERPSGNPVAAMENMTRLQKDQLKKETLGKTSLRILDFAGSGEKQLAGGRARQFRQSSPTP